MRQAAETETPTSLTQLVARVRSLGSPGARVMVGLVGPPGSGKSTLAHALAAALSPDRALVVPMDGFHLAAEVIAGTELESRRGAPDTFDAGGFVHLLNRLRARDEEVVYAPRYERAIEDPIASAIPIPRDVNFLVVEGNYLLADSPLWRAAREHLDSVWFIDIEPEVRLSRLVARHVEFGKSHDEAVFWSDGSDEVNARLISVGRASADLVISVEHLALLDGE